MLPAFGWRFVGRIVKPAHRRLGKERDFEHPLTGRDLARFPIGDRRTGDPERVCKLLLVYRGKCPLASQSDLLVYVGHVFKVFTTFCKVEHIIMIFPVIMAGMAEHNYVPLGRNGPPYRIERETLEDLLSQGLNDRQIAARLGCHPNTVRNTRLRFDLPAAQPRRKAS